MKRKKRSAIWEIPKHRFQELVNNSSSYKEILAYFGRSNHTRGSYTTLKRRIEEEKIDTTKLQENRLYSQKILIKELHRKNIIPLEEILVENSTYLHRHHLKMRLLKAGLLKEKCYKCGLGPEWQGKKLSLQLDHTNGKHDDNRLENLRLLCPNCHSQTETFSGKHFRSNLREVKKCTKCDNKLSKGNESGYCRDCHNQLFDKSTPQWKVERPSKEELLILISTKPFTTLAKEFGVSDNAIRKWCKYYGLPSRKKDIETYLEQLKV